MLRLIVSTAALLMLVVLVAGCATTAPGSPDLGAGDVGFVDVTVVDVESGRLLPGRTVLVRGSRIVRVAPSDRAALPPGTRVVDARGKNLIPGLWDMHVHSAGSAR